MARRTVYVCFILAALLCAAADRARAQGGEPPRQEGAPVHKESLNVRGELKKIGEHTYRLGAVTIDAARRRIICPGFVNMDDGPLELLACTPEGKRHESLLVLRIKPVHLHVALLLLNVDPGRNPAIKYREGAPQLKRKPGDRVLIFVRWKEKPVDPNADAKVSEVRAESLMRNVETRLPMKETTWVFQGSCMLETRIVVKPEGDEDGEPRLKTVPAYGANLDGTIITTYHDPVAIIENPLPTVRQDIFYIPNKRALPPVETEVELIIVPAPKARDKKDKEKQQ